MKLLRPVFFLLMTGFFLSCYISKRAYSSESMTDIFLVQNNQSRIIRSNSEIEIKQAPFSLQFYTKRYAPKRHEFYSAKIAALFTKDELNHLKEGMTIEDIPVFGPATSLAAGRYGYDALVISDYGHHICFYENEEHRRARLLKQEGDELKLAFDVFALFINGRNIAIEEAPISTLYLAILIDRNLNGLIDSGELTKVTINVTV